jgi:hypothetical protein
MIEARSEIRPSFPDRLPILSATTKLWSDGLLRWIARKTRQEMGLALDANGLIRSKKEVACGGVIRRAEKKVAQLMGNHTAKKDGQIRISMVTESSVGDSLIVNGGVNGNCRMAELHTLKLVGARDQTKARGLHRPTTAAGFRGRCVVLRARDPLNFGTCSAEDFVGMPLCCDEDARRYAHKIVDEDGNCGGGARSGLRMEGQ